jgi:hypothetical protein
MFTRRRLLSAVGAIAAAGLVRREVRAEERLAEASRAALATSDLVYLTPIKSNGEESFCHAEIWFAFDETDLFLCTSSEAWRARALAKGLNSVRLWVGEFGLWTKSEGKFRGAPELMARGTLVSDPAGIEHGLELLGAKYRVQWAVWGPRFRNGIADGSRVMLRYRPSL